MVGQDRKRTYFQAGMFLSKKFCCFSMLFSFRYIIMQRLTADVCTR